MATGKALHGALPPPADTKGFYGILLILQLIEIIGIVLLLVSFCNMFSLLNVSLILPLSYIVCVVHTYHHDMFSGFCLCAVLTPTSIMFVDIKCCSVQHVQIFSSFIIFLFFCSSLMFPFLPLVSEPCKTIVLCCLLPSVLVIVPSVVVSH